MIAGTRFSARVLIFSAISGLVLTNSNLLSAKEPFVQIRPNQHKSTETVRNPQNTLSNAIQREIHSARRYKEPRRISVKKDNKSSHIQQVGLTLKPRAFFLKKNKSTAKKKSTQKNSTTKQSGNSKATPQYKTATPQPKAKPGQSEIQRQLEALYRRDGRKMPPMNLNSLPKTATPGGTAGRGAVNKAKTPTPQNIAAKPQQNKSYQPQAKKKWYEKFLPAKTKQTPKRLPESQKIVKKAPVKAPATKPAKTAELPQLPSAPAPEARSVISEFKKPVPTKESVAKNNASSAEGLDAEELEELAEEAAERLEEQKLIDSKKGTSETPLIAKKAEELTKENIVKNPIDDFDNLFPDLSEAEADKQDKPVAKTESAKTPFSGLVLEEEGLKKSEEIPSKPAEPVTEPSQKIAQETPKIEVNPFEPQPEPKAEPAKDENPFEVPVEKVVKKEVKEPQENPFKPQPEQKIEAPAPQPEKQIATSDQDPSIEKKLALIASRGNIKGLKGFCPVALRDNRLLVDARPEFSSSFKSMNYQFASLENKLKFDREPAKYAPAAGGSDIVLLVDQQDDSEGTLDFASWYKGRLYLFSSQKNMDVFMKTPALYVGVE